MAFSTQHLGSVAGCIRRRIRNIFGRERRRNIGLDFPDAKMDFDHFLDVKIDFDKMENKRSNEPMDVVMPPAGYNGELPYT